MTKVNGTVTRALQEGEYLWIVVNSCDSPRDWWPQTGGPIPPRENLTWEGQASIGGGPQDIGEEFEIAVIIIDADLNSKFEEWQQECSIPPEEWPPITDGKIEKGVIEEKILDKVTVIRIEDKS